MHNRVLVVFSGRADFWWQRLLRPGFRHCAVVLPVGDNSLILDPILSRLQLRFLVATAEEIAASLRRRGFVIIETSINREPVASGLPGIWTCVEAVKRVLGLRAAAVQTPWQLYRYIGEQNKNKILDSDEK